MILPSVPGPTGIIIGFPVSVAFCPRVRPSVPKNTHLRHLYQEISFYLSNYHPSQSSAQHFRPNVAIASSAHMLQPSSASKQTATSRTSFCPLFSVFKALKIGGSLSESNFTKEYHILVLGDDSDVPRSCVGIPSTTAPITWWIFPSKACVLASRAPRAGATLSLNGWKARRAAIGRANAEVRRVRATPLYKS